MAWLTQAEADNIRARKRRALLVVLPSISPGVLIALVGHGCVRLAGEMLLVLGALASTWMVLWNDTRAARRRRGEVRRIYHDAAARARGE